jgi:hypothetical protein
MTKIIVYNGNDNENYTLILNPKENVQATIDLESTNQIMLGEDQTMELVDDINEFIRYFTTNDAFHITIKNDGDCLGIIIDVWLKSDPDGEPIATDTLWFDDYHEDDEDDDPDWNDERDEWIDNHYGLFIVDPDDWDDDWDDDDEDWGYDKVRDAAIDSYRAATKEELLTYLIEGLNDDTISDQHWFFLVDRVEEIILQYPSAFKK